MYKPTRTGERVYFFIAETTAFTLDVTLTCGSVVGVLPLSGGLYTYVVETSAGRYYRLASDLWESPETVAADIPNLIA